MDGGSTDGSVDIIRRYAKHLTFWQSRPDAGQVQAINAGLRKATGAILAFLNSDDFLLQGALESVGEAYSQFPLASGWAGGGHDIAVDGYILQTRVPIDLEQHALANWTEHWIHQPGCFFSAKITREVGATLIPPTTMHLTLIFGCASPAARGSGELTGLSRLLGCTPRLRRCGIWRPCSKRSSSFSASMGTIIMPERHRPSSTKPKRQKPVGAAARLLYLTATRNRNAPDLYVRMPGTAAEA